MAAPNVKPFSTSAIQAVETNFSIGNCSLGKKDITHIFTLTEIERWKSNRTADLSVVRAVIEICSSTSVLSGKDTLLEKSTLAWEDSSHKKGILPLGVPDEYEVNQLRAMFIAEIINKVFKDSSNKIELLLFIPSKKGHLIRSDILEIRLADLSGTHGFVNLTSPTRTFTGNDELPRDIFTALEVAAGAAFITSDADLESTHFTREFQNRLSLQLVLPGERPRKLLALVGSVRKPLVGLGFFKAARALNIGIVQLDRPNHWTSSPEYSSWVEAQLPIDRTPDDSLASRIVAAVKGYGKAIDGLVSFFEPLQVGTAKAAEELGLPTAPPSAFAIATDKQRTSVSEGHAAYRVSGLAEALETVAKQSDLPYPLIVKPCSGWGSEGVFRLDSEADLLQAFASIDFNRHGTEVVIEPFCDGPEVDANLVLSDGELLFFEASDDFPKDADGASKQGGDLQTFIELANVMPSALPQDELDMMKHSLHQSLLRLGFCSGFYHLEARVEGSRAKYITTPEGTVDLVAVANPQRNSNPKAWLLEINVRPPGLQESWASRVTYGIDFWGLALLSGFKDEQQSSRLLSIPFKTGHQYWSEIVFVPVIRGGVFDSDDVCAELINRRPELAANISRGLCFFRRGDEVPDPKSGLLSWIVYYVVFSRKSRQDLLEIAEQVRRETRFSIV